MVVQPLAHKPVALITAAPGPLGGGRVQYHLRQVLLFVNAMTLIKPEVFIGMAATKFDSAGKCTDEATRKFVTAQMASFEKWIRGVEAMNETLSRRGTSAIGQYESSLALFVKCYATCQRLKTKVSRADGA